LTASEEDDLNYIYACNSHRYLQCGADELCGCTEGKVFDYSKNSCVSLVDGTCNPRITADTEKPEWCTSGAECRPEGICKCSTGFTQTEGKMCVDSNSGTRPKYFNTGSYLLITIFVIFQKKL